MTPAITLSIRERERGREREVERVIRKYEIEVSLVANYMTMSMSKSYQKSGADLFLE